MIPSQRRGYPRAPEFSPYISAFCYVKKRTLSPTEFKTLNNSITIVPASPKFYYAVAYTSWKKAPNVTYNVGLVTGLRTDIGSTGPHTNTGAPTNIGIAVLYHFLAFGPGSAVSLVAGIDLQQLANQPIVLFASGGNPATGGTGVDGPIEVEVGYRVIPVL